MTFGFWSLLSVRSLEDIRDHLPKARECDRPIAALLTDLKSRGMLEDTLVLWGGEFGRTPTTDVTSNKPGRDHNHYGFSVWKTSD